MNGSTKVYLAAIAGATFVVTVYILSGHNGYSLAGYFGFLGALFGYMLRGMREKRKAKK